MTRPSETHSTIAPDNHTDAHACARAVIDRIGKDIRLALPLGLGKAALFANALYEIAKADPSVKLTIYTALTLIRPSLSDGLERDFGGPLIDKFFGTYPDILYARDRMTGDLPDNVTVEEFFLSTGTLLSNDYAQRHYNSVNYTHAMRRIISQKVNVLGQMIAQRGERYSLSCNSDLSLDLIPRMRNAVGRENFLVVGEVNEQLPFMPNDAEIDRSEFDFLLQTDGYSLAGPPAPRVDVTSYAIGIRAAELIRDGGTLQIGIGSMGDGAAQAIRFRHQQPATYRRMLTALPVKDGPMEEGGTGEFEHGVYGCTEMFTQGMFELLLAGVLKRQVHGEKPITLDGGFFLGPQNFYRRLLAADDETLCKINMTSVEDVNALYGNEELKRKQRKHARFINVAMKATLLGAVTSDALEDGRVVSGVGGQYNFVAQAHELENARSIILLRATRDNAGKTESNIVWSYGHVTVPRHLRDIIITEYGVADLRGQPDEECVKRMLAITDARFIDELVDDAKSARKLSEDFQVPDAWYRNRPETISKALATFEGDLPPYPFGTELDRVEQELAPVLEHLKAVSAAPLDHFDVILKALMSSAAAEKHKRYLDRLNLTSARSIRNWFLKKLVLSGLRTD